MQNVKEVLATGRRRDLVLLGVSGSIAAYRSCDLARELYRSEIPFRVVMSESAQRLVSAATFEALSGQSVCIDQWAGGMPHIELARRAALFAIVPASANTIAVMAHGFADRLLGATYLACDCPVLIAPAMNPTMFHHPAVERNLATLRHDGVEIIEPEYGAVACGEIGSGRLASLETIYQRITSIYASQRADAAAQKKGEENESPK